MSTPNTTPPDDLTCHVCEERRARWMHGTRGREFLICQVCRAGEPCGRCGAERDECECRDGPDLIPIVEIGAEG